MYTHTYYIRVYTYVYIHTIYKHIYTHICICISVYMVYFISKSVLIYEADIQCKVLGFFMFFSIEADLKI